MELHGLQPGDSPNGFTQESRSNEGISTPCNRRGEAKEPARPVSMGFEHHAIAAHKDTRWHARNFD
jgi:hypothetical protein